MGFWEAKLTQFKGLSSETKTSSVLNVTKPPPLLRNNVIINTVADFSSYALIC